MIARQKCTAQRWPAQHARDQLQQAKTTLVAVTRECVALSLWAIASQDSSRCKVGGGKASRRVATLLGDECAGSLASICDAQISWSS